MMEVMKWDAANDYITALNIKNYLGYNDWRLPTVQELVSLFDYDNGKCILPVQAVIYWSGSIDVNDIGFAWSVCMDDGRVYCLNKKYNYYVWPVRGGQINAGIAKIAANDSTYTDNQTGLVWSGGKR